SWKQLPDQTPLRATTADEELIRQYQIEYGDSCVYHLQELPGLWRCVCGAMNRSDEVTCHACGQRLDTLRAIDSDTLERHKEARLETERIEREAQAERERLAKEEEARIASEKKERLKKNGIRAAVVAAVAVVAYLIASVTIIPASKYSSAVGMMEAGNYADAEAAFADLGDYKDASDKVTECQYGRATGLMESGDLESARAVFTSLGEYKDSQTKVEECNDGLRESAKTKAAELILQGKYDDAIAACRDSKVTNTTEENRALFAEAERLAIKNAEIGDKVTYGQYSNKSLALWRVIDKKKDRALLLCDVCLFRSALGEFRSEITWEDVEFRKVMNSDETLSGIFNNYELPNILSQKHVYDGELDEKTGKYKAGTEKKCTDRLFCPNASDILQAFPNARERISTYNGQALFWWLSDVEPRGSEGYTYFRAISWEDGSLSDWYASGDLGIRPAMWVSFE
ncbi:MAG: hypothetical protein IJI12_04440, partial [Atopobiaceae bacterium]|nr:hypothetical protein [Atopobiaceae bacterium]